jgi:hypothetical protein
MEVAKFISQEPWQLSCYSRHHAGSREEPDRKCAMTFMDDVRHTLQHGDATEKSNKLWAMRGRTELPEDVLAIVEKLTDDRSVARMYIPFRYGELRHLAAEIYAKMLFHLGRREPFLLKDSILPLKGDQLEAIRRRVGLSKSYQGPIASFTELREQGLLEVVDEVFERRYFDLED